MILITGGTGLVGTHLLYDLCISGERVRVIKRANSNVENVKKVFSYYTNNADSLLKNIEWVDADLLDIHTLLDAMEGISHVYHCAAMVSFEQKNETEMMKINSEGTANMVNAAIERGIKKFCHVSSIATLCKSEQGALITEETFWKSSPDNSNYSISKYSAEREVWRASAEGLNTVIVNPSMIIGGGNWQKSSANLFSKGYRGLKYYTDGETGFIDVRDVSALMILLMNSEINNQRFLLNAENATYKHFFDLMHIEFKKTKPSIKAEKILSSIAWRVEKIRSILTRSTPLITQETARSAHRKSSYSNKKIKEQFPEYNFISLAQSVKDTCKLFLMDVAKKWVNG